MLEWLVKVYRIIQSLQSLENSKYIDITNKYKWHSSPGSPKRIEWELLGVTTIINVTRVYSNPAK